MANKAGMATGVEVARISVKVSPDTKEFRRELKNELEEIERTLKGDVHITAHLDTAQARADFMRLKAAMDKDRVKLGVDIETDRHRGGKNRKGGIPDIPDVPDIPKMSGFPSFGSGINPAGWAVILGGITTVAAPLVGLITSAMMAMPGLLTSVLAPIGAVTLGMKGIADAAAEAGLTDKTVGKKGKVKTTVGQAIQSLQEDVSNVFRTSLVPVFEKVIGIINDPGLHTGFETIASGLTKMADGFVSAVSSGEGMTKINNSLQNIGNGLGQMSPGISSFTNSILGLVEQFTNKFPDIANWFNNAMAGFDAWVAKVSADGSLSNAFDGLGAVLDKIMSTVADLGQKGIKFFENPENIQMTLDVLEGIRDTLTTIMDVSTAIAGAWNDMFHSGIKNPDDNTKGHGSGRIPAAGKDFQGTKEKVDGVTKSINEAGAAADKNGAKVEQFIGGGGGPGAQAQRRGVGTDMTGGGGTFDQTENKITPPDDTEAKAKLQEYNDFVTKVTGDVQNAMKNAEGTQGGTVAPPNFDAFKAAWNELPNVVNQATQATITAAQSLVDGAVIALQGGGNQIVAAVQQWQNGILSALATMYTIGLNAGTQLAQGMANGITAGTPFIAAAAANAAHTAEAAAKAALGIKSPSRVFMKIGDQTAQGMGVGLENGFGPVLEQAKDLAGKVAAAFSSGGDPTGNLDGFTSKEVTRMGKVLNFESHRLSAQAKALDYQAKLAGKGSVADGLKAQSEELRGRIENINAQKEMLDLTKEYADLQNDGQNDWKGPIAKVMNGMSHMPLDFMQATSKQAMQDIGISGGGLMGALMDYGTQLGDKFVFNVGNMEDALTAQQNLVNKQNLGVLGR